MIYFVPFRLVHGSENKIDEEYENKKHVALTCNFSHSFLTSSKSGKGAILRGTKWKDIMRIRSACNNYWL